jgi:hypothetical protein
MNTQEIREMQAVLLLSMSIPSLVEIMSLVEAYRYLKSRSHALFFAMFALSDVQLPLKTYMNQDENMTGEFDRLILIPLLGFRVRV